MQSLVEITGTLWESDNISLFGFYGGRKTGEPGEKPSSIDNQPKEGKATRVGYKTLKDGKKVRVAKKSGETLA